MPIEEAPEAGHEIRSLHNLNAAEAMRNAPDLKIAGNGDLWQVLCKASSQRQNWMKSTKAMEIPGVGCLVQVTTQQGEQVSEALTFVPGVIIAEDENGGKKLVGAAKSLQDQ